ncbi:MAG TPA: hypothetical protein VGR37_15940 [Longimicrobiaceae bacterium]|nr:hypothetical protein [Longimicrobiaceae bacterium]
MHRILAVLLTAAACRPAPEVEFVATPLSPAEVEAWSAAAIRSAHHEITVRRTITTGSWCRTLNADAVRTGSEITLRVVAREAGDDCPPGEGTWGYMAIIRDLPSGRYDLRVVHTFATPGRPSRLVLRHPVLVE